MNFSGPSDEHWGSPQSRHVKHLSLILYAKFDGIALQLICK